MAAPAERHLVVYEGDKFDHTVTFQDSAGAALNMSGGTWRAQIRETADSATVLASFAIDTTNVATGVLVLSLTAVQTAALPDKAYWDLEEYVTRQRTYLRGVVQRKKQVSRT